MVAQVYGGAREMSFRPSSAGPAAGLALLMLLALAAAAASRAEAAGPAACTQAYEDTCWGTVQVDGKNVHYYSSFPLGAGTVQPRAVLIAVHGFMHDATTTFNAVASAVQTANALDSTLIVAPLFQVDSSSDPCTTSGVPGPEKGDITWKCSDWSDGFGASPSNEGPSAFSVMDQLITMLAKDYPSARTVTVAGFSDGGQMMQRYAAVAAPTLSAKLRFVVSDPGSWLYFGPERPYPTLNGAPASWDQCQPDGSAPFGPCTLKLLSAADPPSGWTPPAPCTKDTWRSKYDRWKYGPEHRPVTVKASPDEMRSAYAAADVHVLLAEGDEGQGDGTAYNALDKHCAANMQGDYRLQRGLGYQLFTRDVLHAKHSFTLVPKCQHKVTCVFTSGQAQPILIPSED
jgi:poly(3-hydroxybutyrate) depolymerase